MKISPRVLAFCALVLDSIAMEGDGSGWKFDSKTGARQDAGETAVFARSLEAIRAQVYEVKYGHLRARDFLPRATDIPAGANTFTWRAWDGVTMAKIISDYADDLPQVAIFGKEETTPIRTVGNAYGYTTQDIRAAAMTGMPLDANLAKLARRGYEQEVERIVAVGDTANGLPGFLNNSSVPTILPADAVYVGGWTMATDPDVILNDLNYVAAQIKISTKSNFATTDVLLPPSLYAIIAVKRVSELTETTVLDAFLKTHPGVTVDEWEYLETADVAGTGKRGVAYAKDPEVLEMIEPMPFTQAQPQFRNLKINVPCEGRIGGTVIRHPLGIVYFDMV